MPRGLTQRTVPLTARAWRGHSAAAEVSATVPAPATLEKTAPCEPVRSEAVHPQSSHAEAGGAAQASQLAQRLPTQKNRT